MHSTITEMHMSIRDDRCCFLTNSCFTGACCCSCGAFVGGAFLAVLLSSGPSIASIIKSNTFRAEL
eukprot:NODE_7560_length_449_cov_107.920000_g6722_i0.p2 GENE.NODE_7560_length_449_cov_107.920000_g6722_i0~~NODE_7560_length_449_cov_107.920000_g6722_i0.p2  ORF type:complete len:66 (+),score=3.55 NODE_7560_length_449_cov_107.920000_g6722_i0:140-337(+)